MAIPAHSRTSAPTPLTLACCTMVAATAASPRRLGLARAEPYRFAHAIVVVGGMESVLFWMVGKFDQEWSPPRAFRTVRNVLVEPLCEFKLACTI